VAVSSTAVAVATTRPVEPSRLVGCLVLITKDVVGVSSSLSMAITMLAVAEGELKIQRPAGFFS
jgi:hypothetical protein